MTENYNTVKIGTVGNSVPVNVALYAHVNGGFAEPARVTLTSDFTVNLPPGFPDFRQGTELQRFPTIPAGAILDLPVPIAASLWALGAAVDYVPPAGEVIATYADTDGVNRPVGAGTTADGEDRYVVLES